MDYSMNVPETITVLEYEDATGELAGIHNPCTVTAGHHNSDPGTGIQR
jgi:hypothetical protein